MICLRCLAQSPAAKLPLRPLRNLRVQRNSITSCKTSSSRSFTHATARSNAAQPFVTPAAASPTARDAAADSISAVGGKKKDKAQVTVQSSVPAGTILKGLNFHKDKQDPIAMEDSEYPDWLWNVLKEVRTAGGAKEQKAEAAKGSFLSSSFILHRLHTYLRS
jgi:large subunit ribosomal protein L54